MFQATWLFRQLPVASQVSLDACCHAQPTQLPINFCTIVFGGRTNGQSVPLCAGASETLIHTPFEVVKIRMQQQQQVCAGIAGTAKQIVRADGLAGLYTGLEAYAVRQIVWNGGFFGLLGLGNATLPPTFAGSKTLRDFLLGLIAGSTATVANNPLDVAKSRIQASTTAAAYARRWSLSVTREILEKEGLNGACKGLPARLYRSAPGHGLLYMGFELIAGFLR